MGKFIVIEGPGGAGKTTLIRSLKEKLGPPKFRFSKEPYLPETNRWGTRARSIEQAENVYSKDRASHVNDVITDALKRGTHIISDRYYHSTVVYSAVRFMDVSDKAKLIETMRELADNQSVFPTPDLSLVIMPSKEEHFRRLRLRGDYENHLDDESLLEKTRLGYRLCYEYGVFDTNTVMVNIDDHKKLVNYCLEKIGSL